MVIFSIISSIKSNKGNVFLPINKYGFMQNRVRRSSIKPYSEIDDILFEPVMDFFGSF